ncbi:TPA: ArsR family transcriptional regulator, partial [Serratia marcescens]|nr:ArsR family transcriptional regulator [Serratia marcescens]HBI6269917.1 ArsR family transcriptional regulator [Serratia marcescens]HBI6952385.1 ArsR family transcriptional regulator [Serratia marcescens]
MSFADFLREDQRLVMLRFLAEMPSYSSNSSVIYQALTRYG